MPSEHLKRRAFIVFLGILFIACVVSGDSLPDVSGRSSRTFFYVGHAKGMYAGQAQVRAHRSSDQEQKRGPPACGGPDSYDS